MKRYKIVSTILPDVVYDKGFKVGDNILPIFSLSRPDSTAGWSDQMTEQLEESSKTPFIDRYNRKVALEGIKDKLAGNGCCYLYMGCSSGYCCQSAKRDTF